MPVLSWECKAGNIRALNQAYAQFGAVLLVDVIGGQSFAKLRGRSAHNMIKVRVVRWVSVKNLDPDGAFLNLICEPVKGHFHYVL